MNAPDPQRVAEAVRDAMWRDDRASKMLGMQILAIAPGTATLQMTVRDDMLNGHDICHGGLVTTHHLPPANRQRPHYVADLYRRRGQ